MKQQTTKNSSVTLDSLYELIKTLPTKNDLKGFAVKDDLKSFATKDDLKSFATRDEVRQIVRAEIKDELEKYPTKYELEEMLTKLRSDFYDKVDPFLREIETAREEREIGSYQMEKVNKKITDHEKRLDKLEQHQP